MNKKYTKIVMGTSHFNTERTEAFNLLMDKNKMAEKLVCTKMCKSVAENKPCPHGEKCRYAHSMEKLVISECFFKERCHFVRKNQKGKYYNKGKVKKCTRQHPDETRENLFERLNLPVNTSPSTEETLPCEVQTDNELVIRVPESMANMAMEMAIANGNTNIRIEIIN
jgi:hypothetical protein